MNPLQSADDYILRISGWSDLTKLVDHFSRYSSYDWLFRGVTDENYQLVPKIGRTNCRGIKIDQKTQKRSRRAYSIKDEKAVLSMFEQQSRAYLSSPFENKLQMLSVAQHFGLPTRLLDWSDSLLVAAWFAVVKAGAKETINGKTPDSAIWITRAVPTIPPTIKDPLLAKNVYVYRPPHISSRIVSQGSVLMLSPDPPKELVIPHTKKIIIDSKIEFTIKKRLNACGINKRQLFPDLPGLCEHLAWLYKHDWLAGYNNQSDIPDDDISQAAVQND